MLAKQIYKDCLLDFAITSSLFSLNRSIIQIGSLYNVYIYVNTESVHKRSLEKQPDQQTKQFAIYVGHVIWISHSPGCRAFIAAYFIKALNLAGHLL